MGARKTYIAIRLGDFKGDELRLQFGRLLTRLTKKQRENDDRAGKRITTSVCPFSDQPLFSGCFFS